MLNFEIIQKETFGNWLVAPKNKKKPLLGGAFDTRKTNQAQIFFTFRSSRHDAHEDLMTLEKTNIQLILVENDALVPQNIAVLEVKDTLDALQQIAAYLARKFKGKIISITGSNGKTTTKNCLSHVLKKKYQVLCSEGSFNNAIGCPITLLNLTKANEILVLELGTSSLGELDLLASILLSDYSILLNIGHAHLGKFGSIKQTLLAKLEIFNHQKPGAVSIVNKVVLDLYKFPLPEPNLVYSSQEGKYAVKTLDLDSKKSRQLIQFHYDSNSVSVWIDAIGPHVNSLVSLILMISIEMDLSQKQFTNGLKSLPKTAGRLVIKKGMGGQILIDDTYNANPESIVNLFQTLVQIPVKTKIVVIGHLSELEENLEVSSKLILDGLPTNLDEIYLLGTTGRELFDKIKKTDSNLEIQLFGNIEQIYEILKNLNHDYVIGIKGARSSHMERLVLALEGKLTSCHKISCDKKCHCLSCEEF